MTATVTDAFVGHARQSPDKPAVSLGAETRTYGGLLARAEQVAAWVDSRAGRGRRAGAAPASDVRVGILLTNRLEFLEVFVGATMAGAVAVVFDTSWGVRSLAGALRDTRVDLLVTEGPLLAAVRSAASTLPMIVLCGPEGRDWTGYDTWLAEQSPRRDRPRAVPSAAPFFMGFTSGTTGLPKAFLRSHASWVASFEASRAEFRSDEVGDLVVPGPLTSSLFLYAAVEGLHVGASVTLLPRFHPDEVLRVLGSGLAARLYVVPTMCAAVTDAAIAERRVFPRVRSVVSSGAKWAPALRARVAEVFPEAETIEFYGASELSFVTASTSRSGAPWASVGRPFPGVTVSIREPDGREAADGDVGQLFVRSPMVCSGYLREREAGGLRVENGWATVGDYAWRDADGYIYLAGRESDMVITGGLNVYPAEVEGVLCALPEIEEAVVFGLPNAYWGQLLHAVVRWREGARLRRRALRQACRTALARHKCPRRVFSVDRFSYTSSGKIARATVREQVERGDPAFREVR